MYRLAALTLAVAFNFSSGAALAQTAPGAKPAPKPATSRQELKSEAKSLALATETVEVISAAQIDVAARVLTGKADCEFNQSVTVDAVADRPGFFRVRFKTSDYVMVPEETTTGAVRLLDRKAGVVWLQIPTKSMLLDSRAGQRLVDSCTQAEQRAAVQAVNAAGRSAQGALLVDAAAPRK